MTASQARYCVSRLGFDKNAATRFITARQRGITTAAALGRLCRRDKTCPNSVFWAEVNELSLELLLYIMAGHESDAVRKALSSYITRLQFVDIEISGHDLIALGFRPGPAFKKILEQIKAARLDGLVDSREEELALVQKEQGNSA
jgi:tRNA nucleotidyltransferase (CCA-adding enzyme)